MAVKKSAPKPSSGAPKSSTATVPFDPTGLYYKEQYSGEKYIYTNTIVSKAISNEPFDDRHYPYLPWVGAIARGSIANHQPPGPYRLRFMFNPNQIDLGFELSGALTSLDQTAGVPTAGAIGGHDIGFKLFFDRHYEVAYNKDKMGVYRDIDILKKLVGVSKNQGYMIQQALKFIFGPHDHSIFYGFIHSLTVSLGFFSREMIPMMAEVSVAARFVPKTDNPNDIKIFDVESGESKSFFTTGSAAAENKGEKKKSEANTTGESVSQWGPAA